MKEAILEGIEPFIVNINRGLDEARIDRGYLTEMDHVCYRVETNDRYDEIRTELAKATEWLLEVGAPAMINGRPIVTYQFIEPIAIGDWTPSYLELPAPKEGSPYPEGLEHAEFVVRGGNLATFQAAHPHLEDMFTEGGMNKSVNPELGLKAYGMSIKFHELALGKVVRIEQGLDDYPITGNHVTL